MNAVAARVDVETSITFARMLERLDTEKHTGPVVIHFAQGKPNTIEIPAEPVRIRIDKRG